MGYKELPVLNKIFRKPYILRYNKYSAPLINLVSLAGLIAVMFGLFDVNWYIAAVMYFMYWCIGVSITFHRYISHFSFNFRFQWLETLCVLIGNAAGQGDGYSWSTIHKQHHLHTDKEHDPHGKNQGWIKHFLGQGYEEVPFQIHNKRLKSKLAVYSFKYYTAYFVAWWLALYIAGGEMLLFSVGVVPVALFQIVITLTTHVTHNWGYRNFNTKDEAKNSWWISIISFGEGWHNNHHAKPRRYTFTEKWWEFDLGGFIIKWFLMKTKSDGT